MSAGGNIAKTIVGGLADVVLKKAPVATAGHEAGQQASKQAADHLVRSATPHAVSAERKAARQVILDARAQVHQAAFAVWKEAHPGGTMARFEAFLASPQGRELSLQMQQDARKLARVPGIEKLGIKVPQDMNAREVVGLGKYLKQVDNKYDKVDVARVVGAALEGGTREAKALALAAERAMYTERGVSAAAFARYERAGITGEQLEALRLFADAHATSQAGMYLDLASKGLETGGVPGARRRITQALAKDAGLVVPKGVDERAVLSVLRDLGTEAPRDGKLIRDAVNEAMAKGVKDYHGLHEASMRTLLGTLGADAGMLEAMAASDDALRALLPHLDAGTARQEQLRLLRDRLRVLPEAPRAEAIAHLKAGRATLATFDQHLVPLLDRQATALLGDPALAQALLKDMPPQQRANLVSDLLGLPADVRRATFAGLKGTPEQRATTAVDRLVARAEDRFGVVVHRTPGQSPLAGQGADAEIIDWSVHAATQLYNGLEKATRGRRLASIEGTIYMFRHAAEKPLTLVGAFQERQMGTFYRPGTSHYRPGQSGLLGKEFRGMGSRGSIGSQEYVNFHDLALQLDNSHRAVGMSRGEGTIVHETAHVVQLGGDREQEALRAWSSLAKWTEPDGTLADASYTVAGQPGWYYKDPAIKVADRKGIVSQYGATDTVEDFAEFSRVFIQDPASAFAVAPLKFLYLNQSFEQRYSAAEVAQHAREAGFGPADVERFAATLARRLGAAR